MLSMNVACHGNEFNVLNSFTIECFFDFSLALCVAHKSNCISILVL